MKAQIDEALEQVGLGNGNIGWEDLAPLDQFHVRGLPATRELATELQIPPGATILDVGSGIGGSSRFLAATYGSHVTGIDLSPPFVEAAIMLSDRAGLGDRTTFRVANALDLPFDDSSFDYAWTQHVAMNISNRAQLYNEICRVLKPGGLLAIYDIVLGDGGPLIFPVPWARDPAISFLLTPAAMRDVLVNSGFEEVSWIDTTEVALAWFAEQQMLHKQKPALSSLGLDAVMQAEFPAMVRNLRQNLTEGRARLLQTVMRKT
jgi:ubiquinone/menaquinone biosynthesis C-methylase UbiE